MAHVTMNALGWANQWATAARESGLDEDTRAVYVSKARAALNDAATEVAQLEILVRSQEREMVRAAKLAEAAP